MTRLSISDLHSTGSELFKDSENYMSELTDTELNGIQGGSSAGCFVAGAVFGAAVALGAVYAAQKWRDSASNSNSSSSSSGNVGAEHAE